METTNRLLVFGGGGHGKVVAEAAVLSGEWEAVSILDDKIPHGTISPGLKVVGRFKDAKKISADYSFAIVAIGDAVLRRKLLDKACGLGYRPATVVHPSATLSPDVFLGSGSVVLAGVVINPGVRIGDACILNTSCSIDHDCKLGSGVHVCPGSHLAGEVTVGDNVWIGIGSTIIQRINIGKDAYIAAGSVVVGDVDMKSRVAGVPARSLKKSL